MENNKVNIFQKYLEAVPQNSKRFSDLTFDISKIIYDTLKEKKLTQEEFASKIGKKPSEISKWLNGVHNFTLKTIANIETTLGIELIKVPNNVKIDNKEDVKDKEILVFNRHFPTNEESELQKFIKMKLQRAGSVNFCHKVQSNSNTIIDSEEISNLYEYGETGTG